MPNWIYNTLRVKGTKKRLTLLAWAIGSPSAAIDWTQLATVVPMTWDARDERRTRNPWRLRAAPGDILC